MNSQFTSENERGKDNFQEMEDQQDQNQQMFQPFNFNITAELLQSLTMATPFVNMQMNVPQTEQSDQQQKQTDEPKQTRTESTKPKYNTKTKSDNFMKNNCYYLYWLLLNLNPSTKITLNGNKRLRSQNDRSRHYSCSSIKIGKQVIFEADTEYVICQHHKKGYQTIQMDMKTQTPVKASSSKKKYTASESCKIQQHILLHTINRLLKTKHCKIPCDSKRTSKKLICLLHFTQYFDVDDNGHLVIIDFPNREFDKLCETLKSVFSFFLDKQSGLTRKMVISDDSAQDSCGLIQTQEKIIISRQLFLQVVWYIRKNGCSVSDVFVVESFPLNDTKDNEKK